MAIPDPAATGAQPDLLVVGAGAGGMATALAAALMGLKVVLCEASGQVGGTTSTSAGTVWVPGNRQGQEAGYRDTKEAASRYLEALSGADDAYGRRQAYLATANEAIKYLERHSAVKFASAGRHPDYLPLPGAAVSGRALAPLPFDGRRLHDGFARIRPPLPDFMVLGGMMVGKTDVAALIGRYRSWRNLAHTLRLLMRHGLDRLRHPRGTRLVMGNALVARLYYSLLQAGVTIHFDCVLCELISGPDGVHGATFAQPGGRRVLRSRLGVVLATGGVGHHAGLRTQLADTPADLDSLAYEGNRGEGLQAALRLGASLEQHDGNFFWQPVSRVPTAKGYRLFPHLYMDRTKPGIIAVNTAGRRFVNEADSYHHFVEAMLRPQEGGASALPCYLICDARFIRQYGLGVIPPGKRSLRPYLRSGYIAMAPDLASLAARLGISAEGLAASVERNNRDAATGVDTQFDKGASALNLLNGDPTHRPNPCLGYLRLPPFYALPVWPADAANSAGLSTDADGRVLDTDENPIPGLYACGNDMASIMRGSYPGPGITLGPALVFGYRIARHVSGFERSAGPMAPLP